MSTKHHKSICFMAVMAGAFLVAGSAKALAQNCGSGTGDSWTGLDDNLLWSRSGNWSLGAYPVETHDVLFDLVTTLGRTTMDLDDDNCFGHEVLSFFADKAGKLEINDVLVGEECTNEDLQWLYVYCDAIYEGGINVYTIELMESRSNGVCIGDPAAATPGDGNTYGFKWMLDSDPDAEGGINVNVADNFGCGQMTSGRARIGVGCFWGTDVNVCNYLEGEGSIDGSLCDAEVEAGNNEWELRGVQLAAHKAFNLQRWTVQEDSKELGGPTTWYTSGLDFDERFDVFELDFTGQHDSTSGSTLSVGFLGDEEDLDEAGGLIVKEWMSVDANAELGPEYGAPSVQVERLLVEEDAEVMLAAGARLTSTDIVSGSVSSGVSFGGEGGPWQMKFEDGASLQYGPCEPGETARCDPMTTLHLRAREDSLLEPRLHFAGNSFLTTRDAWNPGQSTQALRIETWVHVEVEGVLSEPPASAWNTAGVDLVVQPQDVYTESCAGCCCCGTGCACPVQIEAIAPDCGNVWFTDLDEPRCLKHWRSLTLASQEGGVAHAAIVDRHANHGFEWSGLHPPAEAMYVIGDVNLGESGDDVLHLGASRLFYGGELNDECAGLIGEAHPLLRTVWGDFNGDCVVDEADREWFAPLASRYEGRTPPFAHMDYDGDCKVTSVDTSEFERRLRIGLACDTSPECRCGGIEGAPTLIPPPSHLFLEADSIVSVSYPR